MPEVCVCGCPGIFENGVWTHIHDDYGDRAEMDHGFQLQETFHFE